MKAVKKVRGVPGGPEFVVGKGPVPPRVAPLRGPRGSIYPLEQIQPGEYFDAPVRDEAAHAALDAVLAEIEESHAVLRAAQEKGDVPKPTRAAVAKAQAVIASGPGAVDTAQKKAVQADAAKAAQKRSYLSALSKSRGIKAETRYLLAGFIEEDGTVLKVDVVRCWHRGARAVQGELPLELRGEEE